MTKKLIVNADDFGQTKGINKGIIRCHEKGIVTSTSLMVRYDAAIEAAQYAKLNNRLGVGLHLDFGEWVFKDNEWVMLYKVVDLNDMKAVRQEIKEQLEIFFRLLDRKPTHIDSHQHAHLTGTILPHVEEVAIDLDVTLRSRSKKVHYCGNFYGQSDSGDFHPEIISVDGFERIISELPGVPVTELGCHPAMDNDVDTMYRAERLIESETLCNPVLKDVLKSRGYELTTFNGIPF